LECRHGIGVVLEGRGVVGCADAGVAEGFDITSIRLGVTGAECAAGRDLPGTPLRAQR